MFSNPQIIVLTFDISLSVYVGSWGERWCARARVCVCVTCMVFGP